MRNLGTDLFRRALSEQVHRSDAVNTTHLKRDDGDYRTAERR